MENKRVIDLLGKTELFRGLPPHFFPSLADQFTTAVFGPREVVIGQGERIGNLYIVSRGRLEVYVKDQMNRHAHISYLLPAHHFGDFNLLYDQPSATEIVAVEESECLCLSKERFLSLLDIDPEISQYILRAILRQLRSTNIVEEAAKYKEKALQFLQQNKRIGQYTRIIGKTRAIHELNEAIERVAGNDDPVLIEGEYGTGKELIARIVHAKSIRSAKPFISVDCEKLVPETMHTQLFGDRLCYHPSQEQRGIGFSYLELAEGGSLLLKNIEVLPLDVQVRIQELLSFKTGVKQGSQCYPPDVRIMATSRVDLKSKAERGSFDRDLLHSLTANTIYVPPLRERKRDIPDLVDHFIKKYAQYYDKRVDKVSEAAMKLLLTHNYKLSNVQELEEVIERAVTLTQSDAVRSEHIFLGMPATKPLVLFDLLRLKFFRSWVQRRIFPEKIREIVAVVFLLIIGLSLFSHRLPYPYNHVGRVLTWSVWWPAMFISFFFIGRFWCAICPYATYSRLAKRVVKLEHNFPFKKFDFLFMTLGFMLVIWVEEITAMRHSSFRVGVLQLSILSLAVLMGVVYKRDSWCRFVCPLGALISICSMSSIVEVRSNTDVCLNQCTTQDCYKGTAETQGCPMFQHLVYVDNNQTCKLCLNCVRSCTHDNISINVRPPATEIYTSERLNKGLFLFVVALMGILIPILLVHQHIIGHAIIPFTLLFIAAPIALLGILWGITRLGFKGEEYTAGDVLWRLTYAYVPLALTAHIAYQLQFLPIVNNFLFSVLLSPSISANIVIYSKTLFNLFKVVYLLFEFIVFFKIIAYIVVSFTRVDLKEGWGGLLKPLAVTLFTGTILSLLPRINAHIFSLLQPAAESTTVVYSIPLFHVFQIVLFVPGIILSFYVMVRILKKYRDANQRSNTLLAASHFLFMLLYSVIILLLLMVGTTPPM
ncbi:MAG: sigma 54-interacting transcriptional regulator [bacterium]